MNKQTALDNSRKERFEMWKDWVILNKQFPRRTSANETERKLAEVMQNLLKIFKSDPKYISMLNEYYMLKSMFPYSENVRKKRDEKTNMQEIIEWSKAHGRLPNQKSKDVVERRLAYRSHLLLSRLRKHPSLNKKLLKDYEDLKCFLKDSR